LVRALDS